MSAFFFKLKARINTSRGSTLAWCPKYGWWWTLTCRSLQWRTTPRAGIFQRTWRCQNKPCGSFCTKASCRQGAAAFYWKIQLRMKKVGRRPARDWRWLKTLIVIFKLSIDLISVLLAASMEQDCRFVRASTLSSIFFVSMKKIDFPPCLGWYFAVKMFSRSFGSAPTGFSVVGTIDVVVFSSLSSTTVVGSSTSALSLKLRCNGAKLSDKSSIDSGREKKMKIRTRLIVTRRTFLSCDKDRSKFLILFCRSTRHVVCT